MNIEYGWIWTIGILLTPFFMMAATWWFERREK